jgi:hypothetical protein
VKQHGELGPPLIAPCHDRAHESTHHLHIASILCANSL